MEHAKRRPAKHPTEPSQPKSPWFHPRTLLDKTYEIGILFKGFDGTLEIIGGVLLWVISSDTINGWTRALTEDTLAHNPHDFVATHILRYGHQLANGQKGLAVLFLLSHGIVKVAMVIALLRQKRWAYPVSLVLLILFLIYQIYLLITQNTFFMGVLTVFDVVIIWLVWREWQVAKRRWAAKAERITSVAASS